QAEDGIRDVHVTGVQTCALPISWPARFRRVTGRVEIAPGIHVVANRDPDGPYRETPELSLVLETPEGQVLVVGCSHPGIERILEIGRASCRGRVSVVGVAGSAIE